MAREKGRQRNEGNRSPALRRSGKGADYTGKHMLLALIAGLVVGVAVGYQLGRNRTAEDGAPASTDEDRTDRYGRGPGDPHFGHDHP